MWKATIRRHITKYADRRVNFVNIKLTNDRFFYTSDYVDQNSQSQGHSDTLVQSPDTIEFVTSLLGEIGKRGLINPGTLPVSFQNGPWTAVVHSVCVRNKYFSKRAWVHGFREEIGSWTLGRGPCVQVGPREFFFVLKVGPLY
jgi:hypothetical protein